MNTAAMPSSGMAAWRRRIHRLVLCAWTTLFALVWGWALSSEFTADRIAWAWFYSVPLLVPLPGLWRGRRYTHAWATLCVLPYLIVGLTESVANPGERRWAGAILAAALWLFVTLIAYLRVTRPLPTDNSGN